MHAVASVSYARLRSAGRPVHVFWTSVAVFLALNVLENLVHYSIGRRRGDDAPQQQGWWPTPHDAAAIAAVMLVFAGLQGVITWALLG